MRVKIKNEYLIMKKLSFILFVTILLASCDKPISPETSKAFVGEYWMETSTVTMKGDKVVNDALSPKWSPVKIYEENGKLFVRTNFYGAPYLSDDSTHAEPVEVYNERPNFVSPRRALADDGDDEGEGSSIEDIVIQRTEMIIMNGNITVNRNGTFLKSEPIKVKSGSSNVLELEKFTPVAVHVTDVEERDIGTVKCTYEYGPMVKKDDVITWKVDLLLDNLPSNEHVEGADHAVHKNILYRR